VKVGRAKWSDGAPATKLHRHRGRRWPLGAYGSHDAIAAEISKLVIALRPPAPPSSTPTTSACSPWPPARGEVITYGISPADLRAESILDLAGAAAATVRGAERRSPPSLRRALGASVLGRWAAAAVGMTSPVRRRHCASPVRGRMQPVTTPDGVTFIRDDFKAPLWTVDACFDFMKAARAQRKIIVIGTLSSMLGRKMGRVRKRAARNCGD
jgi:UDP-N-acetylmuramyl pentapeptide synthase